MLKLYLNSVNLRQNPREMSRTLETLMVTLAGFSAGIVFGLLLSPKSGKENREWIGKQTDGAKHWVEDHGSKIVKEGEERLHKISSNVKEIIPDLYEATESIRFEDEELEEDA